MAALKVGMLEMAQAVNNQIIRRMIGTALKTESYEAIDEVTHIMGIKAKPLTQSVAVEMERILKTEGALDMDGFITFRMADTRRQLHQLIEREIREYAIQKTCDRFIDGMKRYVEAGTEVVDLVHIIPLTIGYELFAHDYEPIPMQQEGVKPEDDLLGTLLELLPKRIMVHSYGGIRCERIIKTIEKIFADKVEICYNCKKCTAAFRDV